VERLLAIWVPELAQVDDGGNAARAFVRLLDELTAICPFVDPVRFGLVTMPLRGPSRFFGGEDVVLEHVADTVGRVTASAVSLGVADGLFSAFAAARRGVVVAPGTSDAFRRQLPVGTLERRDLATLCRRLGLHTVGAFGDLAPARVAERFSRDALQAHRVARGEECELRGQRDRTLPARVRALRGDEEVSETQGGFFGDHLGADRRAEVVAHRVRRRLGPQGVTIATVRGGRTPLDRAVLVPWSAPRATAPSTREPWPGQIPAPAPITTFSHPLVVRLLDDRAGTVAVDNRGLLSAVPRQLVFDAGATRSVGWFAGPWPTIERWWSARRRRAYLQVLTEREALLVYAERAQWWLAGLYD
jgi:hypothetical protein